MTKRRTLLIKLTSLGDLIHALPAITDAYSNGFEFDWVIDENFQEVATWHPAVVGIYTTNHRAWRASLKQFKTYRSIYKLVQRLRKEEYDIIIDGQGNFKSAALSFCLKGTRAGFDKHSVREKIAHLAYQKPCSVSKKIHAVDRLRQLFAQALDYELPKTAPDCLIDQAKFQKPSCPLPSHYLVFIHSASWNTKLWPEEHWKKLITLALDAGHSIVLPWGNSEEEARARRLALSPKVQVLPRLSLSEIGYVLSHAKACVSVDTGLSHLAAALNLPTITLYGSTDSGLIGAMGTFHLQSTLPCAPCHKKKCLYPSSDLNPPCLAALTPDQVFAKLQIKR